MINIRKGLFETNSSSVHCLVMCSKADFDAWRNGDKFLDTYDEKLVNSDDVPDGSMYRYKTFEQYADMLEESYYETFFKEKDEILAFGYYGNDC